MTNNKHKTETNRTNNTRDKHTKQANTNNHKQNKGCLGVCVIDVIVPPLRVAWPSASNIWNCRESCDFHHQFLRLGKKMFAKCINDKGLPMDLECIGNASSNDLLYYAEMQEERAGICKSRVLCSDHNIRVYTVNFVTLPFVNNMYGSAVFLGMGTCFTRCLLGLPKFLRTLGVVSVVRRTPSASDKVFAEQLADLMSTTAFFATHDGERKANTITRVLWTYLMTQLWKVNFHMHGS